jgi:hypothetical protein
MVQMEVRAPVPVAVVPVRQEPVEMPSRPLQEQAPPREAATVVRASPTPMDILVYPLVGADLARTGLAVTELAAVAQPARLS